MAARIFWASSMGRSCVDRKTTSWARTGCGPIARNAPSRAAANVVLDPFMLSSLGSFGFFRSAQLDLLSARWGGRVPIDHLDRAQMRQITRIRSAEARQYHLGETRAGLGDRQ